MSKNPKRTIESVLDLETGKFIESEDFFKKSPDQIFQFRHKLELDIKKGRKRYVCFYCKQNVKLRGKARAKISMHFAHLKDSDDCPIKTDNNLSQKEIDRIKYNGVKESNQHINLKNKIAHHLEQNQNSKKGITNVKVEVVHKNKKVPSKWKKPDISANYKEKNLVIELQLSTTYLSVIVDRHDFYRDNQEYILWVFNYFEINYERRKFTQSDILYINNENVFELDEKAKTLSENNKDLVLCCHYLLPEIYNNSIRSSWQKAYVKLADLTFDNNYQVYYFDVTSEKKKLEEIIQVNKSRIMQIINEGEVEDIFEYFEYSNLNEIEKERIKILYKEEVEPNSHIDHESRKLRIIWTLIAHRLKKKQLFQILSKDYALKKALLSILSLKTNKIIGYEFKKQIQIAHNLLYSQPEFLNYYQRAMQTYGNISEDKNGKLKKKMKKIRDEKIKQRTDEIVIETIFPELKAG